MPGDNRYLSVDLGASGGTLYTGKVTADAIDVTEVYRFEVAPQQGEDRYVWDVKRLVDEIAIGIERCESKYGVIDSIGIDTWGTDFGFLKDGELLRLPYSYRDPKLTSTREDLLETVGKRRIFEATGICHWEMATSLYHLHYLATEDPAAVERADRLLMMPQLLSTLLGGDAVGEATVASTTQMMDPASRDWARDLLAEAGVPTDILPEMTEPGETIGTLDAEYAASHGDPPDLVLPASHDTASAVSALPLSDENRIFLSTGTMFLPGIELDRPNRSEAAFEIAASNELGLDGSIRFIKNMNGFFLLEESRKAWRSQGEDVAYDRLLAAARKTKPDGPLVDPDHPAFGLEDEMPATICEYCRESGQVVPTGVGEITRCIVESLVVKAALSIDQLVAATDDASEQIHLGGGGVRNDLLCQLLADATNREVVAGPAEATAIGNLLSQALGRGDIPNIEVGRELIEASFDLQTYGPRSSRSYEAAKDRMEGLLSESPQL